jgi:hypothetical protein
MQNHILYHILKLWSHSSESMTRISGLRDIIDIWYHRQWYCMENHIWYHAFETMMHHRFESMISVLHNIIDIWHHVWFDIWYHIQLPPPFRHVRWQIRWQSNDFNVCIPSCTGELGRGEELLSLSMVRSGAWQWWGAELGRGEEWSLAEDWSLEVLHGVFPTGSFVFLLFLWLAVMAASVALSRWSGSARQDEQLWRAEAAASRKVARESVETEVNLKGAAETARWPHCCRMQPPLPSPPTKLGAAKPLPTYCIDTRILEYAFSLACFLLHCMRMNYVSSENHWMCQIFTKAEWVPSWLTDFT